MNTIQPALKPSGIAQLYLIANLKDVVFGKMGYYSQARGMPGKVLLERFIIVVLITLLLLPTW